MIRKASYKDVAKINELGETLHKNFTRTYKINENLEDKFNKIFVYEKDDQVIGYLIATCLPETVDILSIVVDKDFRGCKVATCLIDYLLSEISPLVEVITLEVDVDNIPAINLYKKFGFNIVNTRKGYYNGKDAYLMGKEIKK